MTVHLDYTQSPARIEWVAERLGVDFSQPAKVIVSVDDDTSQILGGVVYSRFTPGNCEMSVAADSPKFLTRKTLREYFAYPFEQLALRRVTILIESCNTHSIDFNRRLGFVAEGLLRNWYGQHHGILMGMLREDCKWL